MQVRILLCPHSGGTLTAVRLVAASLARGKQVPKLMNEAIQKPLATGVFCFVALIAPRGANLESDCIAPSNNLKAFPLQRPFGSSRGVF